MERVLGKHSPRVKQLARLSQASERREQGRFLIEGVRLLEEAWKGAVELEMLLFDPARAQLPRHRALIEHWADRAWEAPGELLEKLGPAESSQGLLGVARLPDPSSLDLTTVSFLLVLDGVRDPGNLGALLRTAWASQVGGVALLNCADPYSPKAVRASAGGLFRVLLSQSLTMADMQAAGLVLVALTPRAGHDLYRWNWPERAAWVLGGEAAGQNPGLLEHIGERVTVPMASECESLNVAAAGAIVMFEHLRRSQI